MKFDRKFLTVLLTELAGVAVWAVAVNVAKSQPLGSMAEKAILGAALAHDAQRQPELEDTVTDGRNEDAPTAQPPRPT